MSGIGCLVKLAAGSILRNMSLNSLPSPLVQEAENIRAIVKESLLFGACAGVVFGFYRQRHREQPHVRRLLIDAVTAGVVFSVILLRLQLSLIGSEPFKRVCRHL